MQTTFAVVRDGVFVENMLPSRKEADDYKTLCEELFPKRSFSIKEAKVETINTNLQRVVLDQND